MKLLYMIPALLVMTAACSGETITDRRPDIDAIEKVLVEQQMWLNNTIGITDEVPPPWQPMVVTRGPDNEVAVDVLGRRYDFSKSLFPSAITTWGKQILAGPIAIKVIGEDGKELGVDAAAVRVSENSPGQVALVSFGSAAGIDVFAAHRIDYDGMAWTKLTINPSSQTVKIRKLFLEIPLKRANAKYITSNLGMFIEPWPRAFAFRSDIWLGDEDVGLCWFAESDEGWDRSGNLDSQMEILDERDKRVLKVNFVNSLREIEASRKIEFGLIATPSKERKKNWHAIGPLFQPFFADFRWDAGGYYPGPKPSSIESGVLFEHLKAEAYFKTSFNYFAQTFLDGTIVPEYYLFSRVWERLGIAEKARLADPQPPQTDLATGDTGYNIHQGSPASSQADWLLWKWDGLIKEYGMRSIYFDSLGGPEINPLHGQGYVDENGHLQETVPILAMRRALQRFYVMLWHNYGSTDAFNIMVHGSSSIPPVLSFAHAHLSGEQFIAPPRRVGMHYTEIVPDQEWIAFFRGKQWGVVGVFLPEFAPRNRAFFAPTQEMMMLTLLHDVPVVAAFCAQGLVKEPQERMIAFGMENMQFIDYWNSDEYLGCTNDRIRLGLYLDAIGKRALLVVANSSRAHQMASIEVSIPFLADENLKIEDLMNGETFDVSADTFEAAVKQLNYRLVAITK